MPGASIWMRGVNKILRDSGGVLFRRPVEIRLSRPIVSFSFDDFPRTALTCGGEILKRRGCAGTYYASAGLMGQTEGDLFVSSDLDRLLRDGHELGCHTFHHCHALYTQARVFEESIVRNRASLKSIVPGALVRTSSYPISEPNAGVKRVAARHAACCRGGGQTFNSGRADLNCVKAFFLEQSREKPQGIRELIRENRDARGWLVFATHDVSPSPSPYGCTPELFEGALEAALESGASVLTVAKACELVLSAQAPA